MLAAESGHEVVVVDGALHFREPREQGDAPGEGDLGSDNARQLVVGANLLRLRATVSGAEQVTEVKVRGWDFRTKEAVEGSAQAVERGRAARPPGSRRPTSPASSAAARSSRSTCRSTAPRSPRRRPKSLVEQLGSAAVELEGVAYGNPDLRAGVAVSLAGVGAPFDGQLRADVVPPHLRPDRRLPDRVPRQRAPEPHAARARQRRHGDRGTALSGVVPAIVSNLDDPDQLGRMKVSFPWLGEQRRVAVGPGGDARRRRRARPRHAARGRRRGARRVRARRRPAAVHRRRAVQRQGRAAGQGDRRRQGRDPRARVAARATASSCTTRTTPSPIATGDGKHRLVLDQKNNKIIIETSGDIEVTSDAKLAVSAPSGDDVRVERRASRSRRNGITLDAGGGAFSAKGARRRSRAAAPSSCRAAARRPCAARSS